MGNLDDGQFPWPCPFQTLGIVWPESNFQPGAQSHDEKGLMQTYLKQNAFGFPSGSLLLRAHRLGLNHHFGHRVPHGIGGRP
jgi:hypothetical protein